MLLTKWGFVELRTKEIKKNLKSEQIKKLLASPAVHSWRTLMNTYLAFYQHFEANIDMKNFSYSKLQILLTIYLNPEISAVKISLTLSVSRANISTFLKRLLEEKFIEEVFLKSSKRPVYILTQKGQLVFEKVMHFHLQEVISTFPCLEPKTIQLLNESTKKLTRSRQ
jgi:DNA-binding MarR family transcriptional regulator